VPRLKEKMTDQAASSPAENRFLQKGDGTLANHIARAVIGVSAVITVAWLGVILWFLVKLALQFF
jgi:hypothetical protein